MAKQPQFRIETMRKQVLAMLDTFPIDGPEKRAIAKRLDREVFSMGNSAAAHHALYAFRCEADVYFDPVDGPFGY